MGNDFESGEGSGQGAGNPEEKSGQRRNKPATGKFKKTTSRLRSPEKSNLGHRPSLEWRLDGERVCTSFADVVDYTGVDEILSLVKQSKTCQSLFELKNMAEIRVFFDPQTQVSQFYPQANAIALNPHRQKGELANLLARELRRAWQHHQGILINPLLFEPDGAILVNRAQMADTLMTSIRIAWELRMSGESTAWDCMTGSALSDISRTYELKARDFRTLNNGEAARAAYDKWFEDNRTKLIDKSVIHQMLLDETGYIKTQGPARRVNIDFMMRLGELPYSSNYLNLPGTKCATDRSYAEVRDRSNANFLWFIKFEQSFQEKERQMIEQSVKSTGEIVDFMAVLSKKPRRGQPTGAKPS